MIPETTFEVDGKKYSLRFSAKTIIKIEKAMGEPISSLDGKPESEITMELVSTFFTESLRDIDGKPLQPSEIDDIIDNISVTEMSNLVTEGFNAAFPKEKKGGAKGN